MAQTLLSKRQIVKLCRLVNECNPFPPKKYFKICAATLTEPNSQKFLFLLSPHFHKLVNTILFWDYDNLKKRVFVTNTIILTSVSIAARFIGIAFRGFMCTKVGPEGIGLYSLVCSVSSFLASIPASGTSFCVTRLVSNYEAKRRPEKARFCFLFCLFVGIILSVICLCLMFYSSSFVANNIFCDKRGEFPLRILSFGIPFLSISACFRGYFFARRQISKIACEQLVEQLVEILIFMFLISSVSKNDVEGACCAIVLGTVIAEGFSCFHSYFMYFFSSLKRSTKKFSKTKILKEIFNLSFTATANSCLKNGLSSAEDILIPNKLSSFQKNASTALCDYGTINGMATPIIMFPSVLISAFSNLLLPEVSSANAICNQTTINKISNRILNFTIKFSIFFSVLFLLFSKEVSNFVYGSYACSFYIFIFAPLIPLIYVSVVLESVLKGLGMQTFCLILSIVLSFVKIILVILLLPITGVKGLIAAIFISHGIEILALYNKLLKNIKTRISTYNILFFATVVLVFLVFFKLCIAWFCFLNLFLKIVLFLLTPFFVWTFFKIRKFQKSSMLRQKTTSVFFRKNH